MLVNFSLQTTAWLQCIKECIKGGKVCEAEADQKDQISISSTASKSRMVFHQNIAFIFSEPKSGFQ